MAKQRFQDRHIAFVDILGFSTLVQRMQSEPKLFTTVRDILKNLDRQARGIQQYRRDRRSERKQVVRAGKVPLVAATSNLQMTAFSDCYVLSETSPAWHVLAAVQALGSRFLAEGILTRGSVVLGQAYHNNRVLFGPGIIEAYRLETKVAMYPRVLVTEEVRKEVWGYHEGLWKSSLLKRDADGCWFVNMLVPSLSSWAPVSDGTSASDIKSHLTRIRRSLIASWKAAQGNTEHTSKVWWLIHQFNKVAIDNDLKRIERSTQ